MTAGREIVMTDDRVQQYLLLLALAADLLADESIPLVVRQRIARILKHA